MMLSLMSFTYARKLQGAMAMKIDPNRLLSLRKKQGWSRPQLAKRSGITVRTIQRLESESESQRGQKSQEHTVDSLAKALGVELGVLTGELPFPESGKVPVSDAERVQIGAQIAPKARLAYDLIKRRYGVSATEIINMAPLFFALLAEGSLAWRREKLKEAYEAIDRLEQIDGFWRGGLSGAESYMNEGIAAEENSIDKADLFGDHLFSDTSILVDDFFDPSTDNPFASYLCKLKAELDIPSVVHVDSDDLMFGSPLKFPDYDICRDELDDIANGDRYAKMALESGDARLSEIPEELKDAGEERAKWLEDKLSDAFKDLEKEIKDLEKGVKDLEKEIKEKDNRIKEMGRPETYPEGVSDEEVWRERLKEYIKEREKQDECREELDHLKKKLREKRGRLEMLITEEKDRSTSLSDTDPEGDSKDIEERTNDRH